MEEDRKDQVKLQQPTQPRRSASNSSHQPPPPPRKCPRCDSSNTKFCYYNNYSLSQPRYFCKGCRRYWTHGGTLRNVPVGGGCRKGKRPRPSVSSPSRSDQIVRARCLSPALPPRNSISVDSSIRDFPSMGISFGGGFLSSLAAAQSASARPNHGPAAVSLDGGNTHYGASTELLQGINFSTIMTPALQQFQVQNDFFTSQHNLDDDPPRALTSYLTQSFLNRDTAASSSSGFWSGGPTSGGEHQAGSSFNPSRWSDCNHPGFPQ